MFKLVLSMRGFIAGLSIWQIITLLLAALFIATAIYYSSDLIKGIFAFAQGEFCQFPLGKC